MNIKILKIFLMEKKNQIKFSEVKNNKNEFLNKLNNIKIGKKKYRTKRSG